jgi:hypothetical protein
MINRALLCASCSSGTKLAMAAYRTGYCMLDSVVSEQSVCCINTATLSLTGLLSNDVFLITQDSLYNGKWENGSDGEW